MDAISVMVSSVLETTLRCCRNERLLYTRCVANNARKSRWEHDAFKISIATSLTISIATSLAPTICPNICTAKPTNNMSINKAKPKTILERTLTDIEGCNWRLDQTLHPKPLTARTAGVLSEPTNWSPLRHNIRYLGTIYCLGI